MALLRNSLVLLALAAAGAAQADNISLRIGFAEGRSGAEFKPLHAEVGKFAVTPNVRQGAEDDQWVVVAKDAQGRVLHEVSVNNGLRRHVETFNPRSGAIDLSTTVQQREGSFEVSLPFDKATASVEVLPKKGASTGAKTALAAPAALARFDRGTLEQAAASGKASRSAMLAATPSATATTILNNGSAATHMDYVFIGDGYTAAEMDKWRADAQKVINGFLADPLFNANRASMNIHRVDVASNQSGVDELDKGIYRDTAMDGEFACYNIERLLCVNNTKATNIAASVLAPDARDVIVVIANSTRYGGSGGAVATLSMHEQSIEVALHEIGHTAFALADEYEYGTCNTSSEPTEVNVSLNGTRSVKWGSLIAGSTAVPTGLGVYPNGTVGTFVGAQYCGSGKYRPTENSRMRTLGYPWHAVNEGAVKKVFAKYTGSGSVTQTGTLANGGSAIAPSASPGWVQAGAGAFSLQLSGPSGADFDLFLYKWSGSAWTKVASSEGNTSSESISYNGTAGYYYAQVKSYSGSGNYSLTYAFPKP
ncbi:M64 family metallopeptidase [Pseudoduganella sp. R-31]|uniref:M64 family metallopeptidase n=1 Tax=unclassified Pseudoduganella TaxID=2637179 RepID=UPI003CF18B98